MVDFVSLFAQFGFPSIVAGALLWVIVSTIEKFRAKIEQLTIDIVELKSIVSECRSDMKEVRDRNKPKDG